MAESRRYALGNQLDLGQILLEAQHRWLRPAEICEILLNYKRFHIAPEPPNTPPSGSLFLFDRKVLRYFRKDGHNWRKKRDGKTVREAHEKLKAGSIDVLHCYYAHGEENENFQRRSYWMLEEELSHIVLVHYREVKGNRTNFDRIIPNEESESTPSSEIDSSASSSFPANNYRRNSQATDTTSLSSAQASEYEDAESAYSQASSGYHSFPEPQQSMMEKINSGVSDAYYPMSFSNDYKEKLSAFPVMNHNSLTRADKTEGSKNAEVDYDPQRNLPCSYWETNLQNTAAGFSSLPFQPPLSAALSDNFGIIPKHEDEILQQLFTESSSERQEFGRHPKVQEEWQASEGNSFGLSKWPIDQNFPQDTGFDLPSRYLEQDVNGIDFLQVQHPKTEYEYNLEPVLGSATLKGKPNYISGIKQPLLEGSFTEDGLKKLDSFNRWMSKELGDVESHIQTSSGSYWDNVETENGVIDSNQVCLDSDVLGPSLSQDQLFSIIDFSPNWAYEDSVVKVLITGRFLNTHEIDCCKWSCMFGEVEVPAEVIGDGVLRCHAPIHKTGRVPFYVTCSNRLACSEVREFEYRVNHIQDMDTKPNNGCTTETLEMRFGKLLMQNTSSPISDPISTAEKSELSSKISSLLRDDSDEWNRMLKLTSENDFSLDGVQEQLQQKLLKEKLQVWLLQKVAEGGKGPSLLDEGGQGVLHFAAALGYDWAFEPTIVAGVNVNFRDVNGWTALHWAAFCGREHTVATLMSLGAAPGALTDPNPKYPSGKTPADLASAEGHKGIAGYLAESHLSTQLELIDLNTREAKAVGSPGVKAVQTASERIATPTQGDDGLTDQLSLKDSLAAVCNATQAAARIHQVFRVQSFQRKQLKESGDDKFGMSNDRVLSLLAIKTSKGRQHEEHVHAAATRIQNKFRSWKGRKDFLIIRQRIVKIQAHVRGHQVRKNYRKIIWSVGIIDKVILRWRRKGSGLRGFKSEASVEAPSMQSSSSKEDDDDFLKEGRKQTEERLQKALARVKSMVQYPEARDQYRRLLNVVNDMQETKVVYDRVMNSSEDTLDFDDDLIDLDALLDEDTLMPTATW